MVRTIGPLVVALALCTSVAHAAGGVFLEGHVDCGQWVKARKENRAEYFEHFLLGVLNGMSMGSRVEFWKADDVPTTRDQAFLWMDRYCELNPLSQLFAGATELMNEKTQGRYSRASRLK